MKTIDLNADMGESFGAWRMGDDAALLEVVSSASSPPVRRRPHPVGVSSGLMHHARRFADGVDAVTRVAGRIPTALLLIPVGLVLVNVAARYAGGGAPVWRRSSNGT